jgi:glycosyltransferase involved in cell wall biosynthesis
MSCAPQVTVVTPTKNRLRLLGETMDSLAAQTFTDWEHLVVDDGSEDGTATYVAERARADGRVRYLCRTGETTGANACRNLGLRQARADLVVFLDSDDLLAPGALARRVEIMRRNADLEFVVFCTGVFLQVPGDLPQPQSDLVGDDLLRFLLFDIPWQTTAPTWRRDALVRLGSFDETLLSWQDVDLHVRALASGMRYLRYPEIDHYMRWQFEPDKTSVQQRRSPAHLKAADAVIAKFERVVREGPGMTWTRQRALCSLYYFVAERWIELGETEEALEFWGRIRKRRLGPPRLHAVGALLLRLQSPKFPLRKTAARICHKWKGWSRFRTNQELV